MLQPLKPTHPRAQLCSEKPGLHSEEKPLLATTYSNKGTVRPKIDELLKINSITSAKVFEAFVDFFPGGLLPFGQ